MVEEGPVAMMRKHHGVVSIVSMNDMRWVWPYRTAQLRTDAQKAEAELDLVDLG